MQSVIEAGIIPPLIYLLQNAEFEIKKEAAWAISNATSGGTHDQIKYIYFSMSNLFSDAFSLPLKFKVWFFIHAMQALGEPGLY